jgi:ribosomal protein S18 acetylase RimI-like enzyme
VTLSIEAITLRQATADDQAFLLSVYAGTREDLNLANFDEDQKQALIETQFRLRRKQYEAAYPRACSSIILKDNAAVGSMIVNRSEHDIVLVDIALLPEHRNRGIGTYLLRTLLREAASAGKHVHLHVLVTSPAVRFYERLGFSKTGDAGVYQFMEWQPGRAARGFIGVS